MVDSILQSPLEMRKAFGRASEAQRSTEVVSAFIASFTGPTGDADFQGNMVSDFESLNPASYLADNSSRFMAQGQWLLDLDIAITMMLIVVHVRST